MPWKTRTTISHKPAAGPDIQVIVSSNEKKVKMARAQVVHPHPPVDVTQPTEVDHEDAGHDQEAQDHPQQVEAVAGLQWVEPDAAEDVGQGDEHDRAIDRRHQHAQRGVEERHPFVAVAAVCPRGVSLLDVHVNGSLLRGLVRR